MRALKISLLAFILTIPLSAQDFWQITNGPYDIPTVYDFLPYNDSTIFLATDEGLIKSIDNGNSWQRINSYKVICLGMDKLNTIYFGISGHLKRSTDGGDSWTDITVYGAAIKDFVIPYRDTIVVGSWDAWSSNSDSNLEINETLLYNGVFRTFDYGATWTQVNNGIEYPGVYELIILSNGSLLVGTSGGGVYKSTNWGDLWTESNNGIPANSSGWRYAESFLELAPGEILTGTHFSIYYSSNYGDNWTFRGTGFNNSVATCFEVDDIGNIFAGCSIFDGVYLSTNMGNNWNYLGLSISINTLGWDSDSRLCAGGLSGGLYSYKAEDSTWTHVYNQGYTSAEIIDLCLTNSGNLIASTDSWGLYYTTDNGDTWEKINNSGFSEFITINDSIFIGGGGGAYVSNDTGKTWSTTGSFSISSLYYEPITETVYLGTHGISPDISGIYTSNDYGQNWQILHEFPHLTTVQTINEIYVTRTNQVILASVRYTSYPGSGLFYRFYKSTDFGQTWEIIIEDQHLYARQIIENDSSYIFALSRTDGDRLLVSEDEGETWITKNISQTERIVSDHKGRIYRAFGNNIQYSVDKGNTWIEVDNSGLSTVGINDMVINQNNRIYLGTTSGTYFGEADSIVLSVEKIEQLTKFYLSQNYPNPFNPSTSLQYAIGSRQFVTLKVYDLLGREVAILVNEEKPVGDYEVEFKGTNLPSGIYFYQLKAGEFSETKKMILLK